jgi:hypothetical protein
MSKTKPSETSGLPEYDGKYDNLTIGQLEALQEYHSEEVYKIYQALAKRSKGSE